MNVKIKCLILFLFNMFNSFVLIGQTNDYIQLSRFYEKSGNYLEAIRLMKIVAEQEKDTEYYIDDIATIAYYYSVTSEIDSIIRYNIKLQELATNLIDSNDSIAEEYFQSSAWNYYRSNQYILAVDAAEKVLSLRENVYGVASFKWFEWIGVMGYEAFMFDDLDGMKKYCLTELNAAENYYGINSDYFKGVISSVRAYAHQLVSFFPQFTAMWIEPYYQKICEADILPEFQYEFEIILLNAYILMDDLKSASVYSDKLEKKARFDKDIALEDKVRLFLKSAYYDLQIGDDINARLKVNNGWDLLQKENISPSITLLIDKHIIERDLRIDVTGCPKMDSEWIIETATHIINSNIENDETIAFFYESRAYAHQYDGNYEQAINDLKSAIALVPLDSRKIKLAQIYLGKGDYEEAESMYIALYNDSTILDIQKHCIESDMVALYWEWKKISKLESFLESNFKNMKSEVRRAFSFMNENEREIFLTKSLLGSTIYYDLYTAYSNEKLQWGVGNEYAYNLALVQKGLLLSTTNDIDNILKKAPKSMDSLIEKYEKLKIIDIEDPLGRDFAKDVRVELMKYVVEQPEFLSQLDYTWEDVRKSLSNGDVAIEFINLCGMRPGENIETAKPSLGALILRESDTSPIFVNLGAVDYIDSLFGYTEYGEKFNDIIYSGDEKQKLYKKIWEPLLPYIEGCNNIFYSPTGVLYEINLDFIGKDDYDMICDSLNLYRLSSTRELCEQNKSKPKNDAILYGDIAYSIDIPNLEDYPISKYRSTTRDGFTPLKGTSVEIDSIAFEFIAHNYDNHSFVQDFATESSFRALSGNPPAIIHLATHGFYYSEESIIDELQHANYIAFQWMKPELYHSGLALSGAQNTWVNNTAEESYFGKYYDMDQNNDGILLSAEIASLDLSNVDLVVLSACETALGRIKTDGVYGLQRAFKLAGVNSIIMSLWKVDDDATQILMTSFYKNYLGGMSKREALLKAQNDVRKTPGYEDPYYWAAFVLLDGLN